MMSTKSAIGFEWSVKLIGHSNFVVGIASGPLQKFTSLRDRLDQNAILYCSNNGSKHLSTIITRTRIVDLKQRQVTGDVARFKFQPQRKNLSLSW